MKNHAPAPSRIVHVATVCLLITLSACQHSSDPRMPAGGRFGTLHLPVATSLMSIDTSAIDGLLTMIATRDYMFDAPVDMATGAGYFANATTGVYADASINGLRLPSGGPTGYYTERLPGAIQPLSNWRVTGYDNGAFGDTSETPATISFTRHFLDTVSRSEGFVVPYNGAQGGDLVVDIMYHPDLTRMYADPAAPSGANTIAARAEKYAHDDGAIQVSPADLSKFPANCVVQVMAYHYNYHTAPASNGRRVGVLNAVGATSYLYVKP